MKLITIALSDEAFEHHNDAGNITSGFGQSRIEIVTPFDRNIIARVQDIDPAVINDDGSLNNVEYNMADHDDNEPTDDEDEVDPDDAKDADDDGDEDAALDAAEE